MELNEFRVSVRTLVEYVFSSGSIDMRFRSSSSMTDGTKAHQKLQKMYSVNDEHEVFLETSLQSDELIFNIEGRCDGILHQDDMIIIDEIKSTARDLSQIHENSYPVHWAQAKCYAYIYAFKKNLQEMHVQLTYFQIKTEETKRFIKLFTTEELTSFMEHSVRIYAPYARMRMNHQQARDASISELPFPFRNYREGQRKLAGSVYKTISESKNIFAKAPTGIGKTISTTFPAVKAIGEGILQKFFYLTAKSITRQAAEEALQLMKKQGLTIHTVTLTAKEKVCLNEEVKCNPESCPFAEGYYDRINAAVLDILNNETNMTREVIAEYAVKHQVCPFEYSLDLAYSADAIICDYNYIFDPRVSLKRMFDEQKKKTALLIDEAHNLVDRAREMYSANLNKSTFLDLYREYKGKNAGVAKTAKAINDFLLRWKKSMGENTTQTNQELPNELIELLNAFIEVAETELLNDLEGDNSLLMDSFYKAQNFIKSAKLFDERFVTYVEVEKSEVTVNLYCLDPSHLIRQFSKGFRSKVYFSATFTPLDYFKDMLGAEEDDYTVSIPSPFSSEQTDVFIYPLSTRYNDRDRTKDRIVKLIQDLIEERPGKYLIFFPSYAYMTVVFEEMGEHLVSVKSIVQERQMSEEQREEFLQQFHIEEGESLIGFAVLGGIFSEGVDLIGNRLNGVVVVGVGLPQLGLERNILKDYFTNVGKNGFDYAYVYPGINKVLQAGGRLIRSENDHGIIVLVDDRFLQDKYLNLLPSEWLDFRIIN